jgi:TPR repeat protein
MPTLHIFQLTITVQATSLSSFCIASVCAFQKLLDSPSSGPLQDASRARHWLRAAAQAGHAESQFLLAQRLEQEKQKQPQSQQQPQHEEEALKWYTEAAKGGHAQAQYLVGLAHLREPTNPTTAASSLGVAHLAASSSSSPSSTAAAAAAPSTDDARFRTAAHWFAQACEQGNVGAQARMGFLSYHGVGTKRDEATALMWLSNAAEAVSSESTQRAEEVARRPDNHRSPVLSNPTVCLCLLFQNHVDAQLLLGSIAYDEHVRQLASGAPATGSRDEGKKLATARAYFDKVLENANKACTSLPSGSLPLLVRWAQDAQLPTQAIRLFEQRTGKPWIGDINILLAEVLRVQQQQQQQQQPSQHGASVPAGTS